MKWLKLDKKEKRSESLTVRLSKSSIAKMQKLTGYLEKQCGKGSQADLIEQLIDVAYEEMARDKE